MKRIKGTISENVNVCYHPQTKFAKVMFLQVSVCPRGGHAWLLRGGACMVKGGMHGEGGRVW